MLKLCKKNVNDTDKDMPIYSPVFSFIQMYFTAGKQRLREWSPKTCIYNKCSSWQISQSTTSLSTTFANIGGQYYSARKNAHIFVSANEHCNWAWFFDFLYSTSHEWFNYANSIKSLRNYCTTAPLLFLTYTLCMWTWTCMPDESERDYGLWSIW